MQSIENKWQFEELNFHTHSALQLTKYCVPEFLNALNSDYYFSLIDEETGVSTASVTHDQRANKWRKYTRAALPFCASGSQLEDDITPRRPPAMSEDSCDCHSSEGVVSDATVIWWVEARDAA